MHAPWMLHWMFAQLFSLVKQYGQSVSSMTLQSEYMLQVPNTGLIELQKQSWSALHASMHWLTCCTWRAPIYKLLIHCPGMLHWIWNVNAVSIKVIKIIGNWTAFAIISITKRQQQQQADKNVKIKSLSLKTTICLNSYLSDAGLLQVQEMKNIT